MTSAAERKMVLARDGIAQCTCASCTNATPETDALRKSFEPHVLEYFFRGEGWVANDYVPDKSQVDEMLDYQKAVIKEGLHAHPDYWSYFVPALVVACDLAKMESERDRNMKELEKYCRTKEALKAALQDSH